MALFLLATVVVALLPSTAHAFRPYDPEAHGTDSRELKHVSESILRRVLEGPPTDNAFSLLQVDQVNNNRGKGKGNRKNRGKGKGKKNGAKDTRTRSDTPAPGPNGQYGGEDTSPYVISSSMRFPVNHDWESINRYDIFERLKHLGYEDTTAMKTLEEQEWSADNAMDYLSGYANRGKVTPCLGKDLCFFKPDELSEESSEGQQQTGSFVELAAYLGISHENAASQCVPSPSSSSSSASAASASPELLELEAEEEIQTVRRRRGLFKSIKKFAKKVGSAVKKVATKIHKVAKKIHSKVKGVLGKIFKPTPPKPDVPKQPEQQTPYQPPPKQEPDADGNIRLKPVKYPDEVILAREQKKARGKEGGGEESSNEGMDAATMRKQMEQDAKDKELKKEESEREANSPEAKMAAQQERVNMGGVQFSKLPERIPPGADVREPKSKDPFIVEMRRRMACHMQSWLSEESSEEGSGEDTSEESSSNSPRSINVADLAAEALKKKMEESAADGGIQPAAGTHEAWAPIVPVKTKLVKEGGVDEVRDVFIPPPDWKSTPLSELPRGYPSESTSANGGDGGNTGGGETQETINTNEGGNDF